jgi:anti-sigma-K factor RskA
MDLAHPDRRERLDALAAQYALGTLRGRARDRFVKAARSDPVVATAAHAWEARLASLAEAVPAVTPPPRVWSGIATRLGLRGAGQGGLAWWQRLGFWRGFALASFAAAAILSVVQLMSPAVLPAESLVIVLAGPDARPALIATAARGESTLTVKPVGDVRPEAGRAFELWALPEGGAPRSLGVLPPLGVAKVTLAAPSGEALARVPTLAVSLEPPGGSPTGQPTGPVLYTGKVERFY